MPKFFVFVNEVDSHNNSRQSDLVLEKFWVPQCGWIWFCTTVVMGMTITNCWKLFHYGIKRENYYKFIGIRYFLELLAMDFFSNTFTTDTGMLAKNIHISLKSYKEDSFIQLLFLVPSGTYFHVELSHAVHTQLRKD